jgi:hypothetical protein
MDRVTPEKISLLAARFSPVSYHSAIAQYVYFIGGWYDRCV